jgi:hypothetical protein
MEATRTKTNLGLILKLDALTSANDISEPFSVHLVVNRLQLDDDGNICLTSPMGLHSFLEAIDVLKSELDGLANDAILWLARSIASRRVRFTVISNSGGQKEMRAGDGEDLICDAPSPLRPQSGLIQLLPRGR